MESLLHKIGWSPSVDRLWLAGDLVNRGPDSLSVLRFAFAHQDSVFVVLGNHDIYLLARPHLRSPKRDTLHEVMGAPDREELLGWLRAQPLVRRFPGGLLVHAGLAPTWTAEKALERAARVSGALQASDSPRFLQAVFDRKHPDHRAGLGTGLRSDLAFFTTVRFVDREEKLLRGPSGPPGTEPAGARPWFEARRPGVRDVPIYFGHWAALGYHESDNTVGLDSGCVWGGRLTARRIQDGQVFQVRPAAEDRLASSTD